MTRFKIGDMVQPKPPKHFYDWWKEHDYDFALGPEQIMASVERLAKRPQSVMEVSGNHIKVTNSDIWWFHHDFDKYEAPMITKIRKTDFRLVSIPDAVICLYDLIGKKCRVKLRVNLWGDIYNKKKVGKINAIKVSVYGVEVYVLFQWTTMKGFQQQELWIPMDEVEMKQDSAGFWH